MEIAKLVVAALTPLSVALIGVLLARSTRRFEHSRWLNQKLIEKRIELLSEALPKLNDLYCYFCWVGTWASFSPADMLQHKRDLDRLFHANRAFFTAPAFAAYNTFIDALFEHYSAPGIGARLRTEMASHDGDRRSAYPKTWDERWKEMFTDSSSHPPRPAIRETYAEVVAKLGAEVSIEPGRP